VLEYRITAEIARGGMGRIYAAQDLRLDREGPDSAKDDPGELYDLATDCSETNNLATAHPDKVQEVSQRWTDEAAGDARP
jgi:arylsulfatase A-like enzyme